MRDGALFFFVGRDVRGRGGRLGAMPKWAFDCVAYCQGELQTRPCRAQTVQFSLTLYSSNAHFGKAPNQPPLPLTVYWRGEKTGRRLRGELLGGREGVTQRLGIGCFFIFLVCLWGFCLSVWISCWGCILVKLVVVACLYVMGGVHSLLRG